MAAKKKKFGNPARQAQVAEADQKRALAVQATAVAAAQARKDEGCSCCDCGSTC
ncbi:hypothetical protein [uncultured Demequina sp.]|uniref:hypothetical protein n=1 Tax=uncultured Demequina sp. TaxID=693499 RepID=UPI0025E9266B|nr:hypothetical protein [uncultured Demequina sp.]